MILMLWKQYQCLLTNGSPGVCSSKICVTNLSNHIFFSSHVNVSIPKTTRRNGSLFVHIYLHPQGSQPFQNDLASYNTAPLTKYALNKGISFNLLSEKPERNAVHTCIINPYNKYLTVYIEWFDR